MTINIVKNILSIKYQPAEGWHFLTIDRWWQDYSIDINTGENPVRGVRAIIENHNNGSVTALGGL